MARLRQWCADATEASKERAATRYGFVYVDQESFEQHKPSTFAGLAARFTRIPGGLTWHAKKEVLRPDATPKSATWSP